MTSSSRHDEFANRLAKSLSSHPQAPPAHGRNTWLRKELAILGLAVSLETIRKWLSGEALPRPTRMGVIAQALKVDATWLEVGVDLPPACEPDAAILCLEEALETILQLSDDERIQSIAREALTKAKS